MGIQGARHLRTGLSPGDGAAVKGLLRAADRRIRLLLAIRDGGRGLLAGVVLAILVAVAAKLHVADLPAPATIIAIISVGLACGILAALLRPLKPLDIARLTERRADLKERLSSAVEFRSLGVSLADPFFGEQLADADKHAAALDLSAAYPLRFPRELALGLVGVAILLGIYVLPTLPVFLSPQAKVDQEIVVKHGIHIVILANEAGKTANQQKLDETRKAAEEARKLGEAMRKGGVSKKQALIGIQKLTQKMEQTQQKMAQALPPKSLQQAHEEFKKALQQMQKEAEKAQMQRLTKAQQSRSQAPRSIQKPGQPSAPTPSQAMKQSQQALQQMADALANQDNKQMQQAMEKIAQQMQSGQLSKEEMQQLQKALQQLAQALKNSEQGEAGKQLEQMAQQMQNSMNNLDAKTLQQMAAMANKIAQNMGKNPGMKGPMMDAQALQQLMEALKNGRMTMAMGKLPGKGSWGPGNGPGRGPGWNGTGHPSSPMKDPGATDPKLLVNGHADKHQGVGKSGAVKEFAKYLAKNVAPSGHQANGKIAGSRTENGNELQMNFTGDPDPARSSSPYFNAYETSKRQAESTLNKENIPAAYKDQVRKYFEEIRP